MKNTITSFLTLFIAISGTFANSATLKTETTTKIYEDAKLVKSVVLQNDDKTEAQMTYFSSGLRKKAVHNKFKVVYLGNKYIIINILATIDPRGQHPELPGVPAKLLIRKVVRI